MINSTLAVVLVVVAVFGVPLALVEVNTIRGGAQDAVEQDAVRLLSVVESAAAAGLELRPETLDNQLGAGRSATVELPDGRGTMTIGSAPDPDEPVLSDTERSAEGSKVTVSQPTSTVNDQLRDTLLVIAGGALLAILAAVVLAVRQANRLTSPLTDLAATAERLGSGDPRPRERRYGIPELDRVAEVLDASAVRIARMLTAERRLAADASHQLRTPLTALSMRLEEIVETAGDAEAVQEEAGIALVQVGRLTDVVQRLLTNSRDPRNEAGPGKSGPGLGGLGGRTVFALDGVVKQQVEEWRPAAAAAHRQIVREGERGLRVAGTPGTVAQVLAAMIENALMHGAGTVALRVRTTGPLGPAASGGKVVLEVEDAGEGVPADLGSRVFERAVSGHNSTGLGLAVARDLAEADGGRLELVQMRPPVFALFLTGTTERADGPEGDEGSDDGADGAERANPGDKGEARPRVSLIRPDRWKSRPDR